MEFGIITDKSIVRIQSLLEKIVETDILEAAKIVLAQLDRCIDELGAQLVTLDARLAAPHKAHSVSQRVAAAPGVGPTIALTLATKIGSSALLVQAALPAEHQVIVSTIVTAQVARFVATGIASTRRGMGQASDDFAAEAAN